MLNLIKQFLLKLLFKMGYQVQRLDRISPDRSMMDNAIKHLLRFNIQPATVIDVGAANGTTVIYKHFPKAQFLLVEPLIEYKSHLELLKQQYPKLDYVLAAASSQAGEITFNVHNEHLYSSSRYYAHGFNDNTTPRTIPTFTLDQWCAQHGYQGPYLIKIDVQGAELDVLRGAQEILQKTDYVVMEVLLIGLYEGSATLLEILNFMDQQGFAVYEIIDLSYRPLDNAMAYFDIAFVPKNSPLRKDQRYGTDEQWQKIYRDTK
jgi:FkbM family methyltransferase